MKMTRGDIPGLRLSGEWYLAPGITRADCVAAYQPIGSESLAKSYVNLAHPGTNNAAPGVAPSWTALNGWIFNGTKHLRTGVIPTASYSALVRVSNASMGTAGFGSTGVQWVIYFAIEGIDYIWLGSNNYVPPALTSGVFGLAGNKGYRNGVLDKTLTGTPTLTNEIYIGAINDAGTATYRFTGNIQAFAVYSTTLTASQALKISNDMARL